jgi:DNA-binding NarL/FixJ family response regulator
MSKIRILVADDHALVREGIVAILKRHDDIEVLAEAADGKETVQKAAKLKPDIVLLVDVTPHEVVRERHRQLTLECALQRPRAVPRVEGLVDEQLEQLGLDVDEHVPALKTATPQQRTERVLHHQPQRRLVE